MKRPLFLLMLVLALTSLACGLVNGKRASVVPTVNPPAATEPAVIGTEQAAETPVHPTATVVLPTALPESTATQAPTNTIPPPSPTEYEETFDRPTDNWSEDFVVTTQSFGRDLHSQSTVEDGVLRFLLEDKETYLYKFFVPALDGNVSVEADFQSLGAIFNGIAIACRVNNDRTSWFEVRVSSTSDFVIYRYEKRLRDEEDKNPYVMLGNGRFKIDELYPTKPNRLKVTCLENEIILETNQGARSVTQPLESSLEGEYIGIGVMSYNVLPITIDFDRVFIREE